MVKVAKAASNPKRKKLRVSKSKHTVKSIKDEGKVKRRNAKDLRPGKLDRSVFFPLMKQVSEDEFLSKLPRLEFRNIAGVLRTACRMYGMPFPRDKQNLPLGYDSFCVIDNKVWCWPNDEAFKLLVKAKYLLKGASVARVSHWLDKELTRIGYDFRAVRGYNPLKGLAPSSLYRLMQYYTPDDNCVLPLDEREILFRVEVEDSFTNRGTTSE